MSGFFESGENLWGELAHAACTKGQNQIPASSGLAGYGCNCRRDIRGELDWSAFDSLHETFCCYTLNWLFAGCVDWKNNYAVRVLECTTEFV